MEPEEHSGIVVILDALGTKEAWKTRLSETLEGWKTVNHVLDRTPEDDKFVYEESGLEDIEFLKDSFSDTMIMTIRHKSDNRIDGKLLAYGGSVVATTIMLGLDNNLLFRGCLSVGKYYRGEHIILGPAVQQAANYHEMPNWIGASATPSAPGPTPSSLIQGSWIHFKRKSRI